jgi:hypothetical protein
MSLLILKSYITKGKNTSIDLFSFCVGIYVVFHQLLKVDNQTDKHRELRNSRTTGKDQACLAPGIKKNAFLSFSTSRLKNSKIYILLLINNTQHKYDSLTHIP